MGELLASIISVILVVGVVGGGLTLIAHHNGIDLDGNKIGQTADSYNKVASTNSNAQSSTYRQHEPPSLSSSGSHTLKVTKNADGEYYTPCRFGSLSTKCQLDSGASLGDGIMAGISDSTARAAAIDMTQIEFDRRVEVGSGILPAALITVPSLEVGPFTIKNAGIMVQKGYTGPSSLTSEFMDRFTITMRGGMMTISSE